MLFATLTLNAATAWAETIVLKPSDGFPSSYQSSDKTFTKSEITFGCLRTMYNANGTPSGWYKQQVMQLSKHESSTVGGDIWNVTSINNIVKITVKLAVNNNDFKLFYGTSAKPSTNSIAKSSASSSTETITYSGYSNKTEQPGKTTTINVFTFDLSSKGATHFLIDNGSKANYIWEIVIETSSATPVDPEVTFSNGSYTVGGSALDLSTLWTSTSDGAVTYSLVEAGTTGASINGKSFTATAAGTCTVKASQAATSAYNAIDKTAIITVTAPTPANPYKVTLEAGPGTCEKSVTEASAGAGVTLPTPTLDCGNWEFAGWTTSSVATKTTSKPEILLTGTYSPLTDITLYAVYKRTETTEGAGTTEVTKTVSISDYASAKSWNNDNRYTTVNIDANITATASSDPATNTGKYYSNDNSWRFYQNEKGKLTITANEGITLKSIKLTFTNKDYGTISYNSNSCTSNTAISVSGQSATFTVGSSSGSKGKILITKISVTYESISGGASTTYYHSTPECAAPCTDPGLAYAIASVTKTVGDAAFTNPLTNNKNVSVTYTSTNTDVATVDNNGQVKIKAVGETTIKATWAGNADYCADEASYTLTVLPKTYTITVANNISNGSVSADKSTAVEGATIKLTATPNTGYKLGTWNVKDASNNPVSVNENGEFTMPASNVTVSATFVSLPKLATPSNLSATEINPTSATLSWTKVDNKKEYKVTITDDYDYTETFTVTDETKSVSSLSPNTTYYWTVKAIGDGTSYSDSDAAEHTFTTTAASTPEPGTGDEEGEYVWKLVENVSELHNLDEVIITASGEINYALSTDQKSSNRGATPITKEGKLLKDPSDEVQIITLVETGNADVFGFNTGSGHLYAASSSGNQLKTKSSLDEHGKWTITISEGVASIVATASTNRNVMQYNPNNSGSPLFACYSSASQTSLAIYKKVTSTDEPETPTPDEEYISGKWKLVDATSKLQAGMEIIIASVAEEGAIKTMAEQRDNNRGAVASSLDGEYLKPAVGTTLITLEDCQLYEGLFALKTKDGYLYAASSSSNQLKSRDAINDNACWEIAITNGVASAQATKSSNRNVLRYNPNNGAPLFSCYASGQKDIALYAKVPEHRRTTSAGRYGTICLPGNIVKCLGATLYEVAGKDGLRVVFDEVLTPEAGMPYIFLAHNAEVLFYCGDQTAATPGDHKSLHGTFTVLQNSELEGMYMVQNNKIVKCNPANSGVAENRAYFNGSELDVLGKPGAQMPGRRRITMGTESENTATGTEDVIAPEGQTLKLIENGQLIIIRNGEKFNAQGQKL